MKLMSLLESSGKCIAARPILMDLLNHKNGDNVGKDVSGGPEKPSKGLFERPSMEISSLFKEDLLKERSE